MMEHHKGAVTMVEELHRQPGTAYDPAVFNFTNDVVSDQNAEMSRMNAVRAGLSNDPRATLAAGFRDAGQAISNLRLVAAMPKAPGFFDPENPAQLQPEITGKDAPAKDAADDKAKGDETDAAKRKFGQRSRSEERSVGKECASPGRSRWPPSH